MIHLKRIAGFSENKEEAYNLSKKIKAHLDEAREQLEQCEALLD